MFGPTGRAMSPTHTRRGGRLYRYYVCQSALKGEVRDCRVRRVPAAEIEAAVIDQLRAMLSRRRSSWPPGARRESGSCRSAGGDGSRGAGAARPALG